MSHRAVSSPGATAPDAEQKLRHRRTETLRHRGTVETVESEELELCANKNPDPPAASLGEFAQHSNTEQRYSSISGFSLASESRVLQGFIS